ncbi:MAG: hypothetical protein RLZZ156_1558 [Deinococcota bacterium]|jgi:hypothetical protein
MNKLFCFLGVVALLAGLSLAQSNLTWRALEYTKDQKLEYRYQPSSTLSFLATVSITSSQKKTWYGAAALNLTAILRQEKDAKPEPSGSFNTLLTQSFLTNEFIFMAFSNLEFRVGVKADSMAQIKLTVTGTLELAGRKGFVVRVEAPDSKGIVVLTSEFVIDPSFPIPLRIQTYQSGKLEQRIELLKFL